MSDRSAWDEDFYEVMQEDARQDAVVDERDVQAAQSTETGALLLESPMDRYECCEHCRTKRCPRHDGHPDPCSLDPLTEGCEAGSMMLGEHRPRPDEEADRG